MIRKYIYSFGNGKAEGRSDMKEILGGKGAEDRMWLHVLKQLAAHFGVETRPTVERVVVDKRRQWEHWRNIKKNAAIRSGMYMAGAPVRLLKKPFKRKRAVA